jgi:hypothetical protein
MKTKLFIIFLVAVMLVMVMGFAPGPAAQFNRTAQAATPTPIDQITVPGFTIQINPPGPNPLVNKADDKGRVADILLGIWHGIISPATLVMSFINPDIQMYEVHNNGSQYNLGFLIGVALIFLILGMLAGSRR